MQFFKRRVYGDAAAATPLSASAKRELMRLLRFFGNPSPLHQEAVAAKRELDAARASVARSLGAHADEIIFTSGGTEANNLAIFGVVRSFLKQGGKVHAITSAIEHSSVLEPLHALEEEGLELTVLPVDGEGLVSPKSLREAIKENTVLVSIQIVNSEIGTIQDIRELAKEIRHARKGRTLPVFFHCDAAQAPLWLPLNVEKLGIDLLTQDGQKIMGPKGVGCLFVRRGVPLTPLIYGGGQESGKRSGTENLPLIGSLAVALKEAQTNVEERAARVAGVRDQLWEEITQRIPHAILNGPRGENRVANNLNFSIPNLSGDMAVVALDAEGVAASTRSACDTNEETPSPVLQAIRLSSAQMKTSLRLTLLPSASVGEARRVAKTLAEVTALYSQE